MKGSRRSKECKLMCGPIIRGGPAPIRPDGTLLPPPIRNPIMWPQPHHLWTPDQPKSGMANYKELCFNDNDLIWLHSPKSPFGLLDCWVKNSMNIHNTAISNQILFLLLLSHVVIFDLIDKLLNRWMDGCSLWFMGANPLNRSSIGAPPPKSAASSTHFYATL